MVRIWPCDPNNTLRSNSFRDDCKMINKQIYPSLIFIIKKLAMIDMKKI